MEICTNNMYNILKNIVFYIHKSIQEMKVRAHSVSYTHLDVYKRQDLIRSCDVLITDYRSILMADCNSPTSVLRFLPEDDPYPLSSSLQKALQFVPACTNAPALIRQLQATLSVSDAFASDMLQAAKMPESRELSSHPGSGDL